MSAGPPGPADMPVGAAMGHLETLAYCSPGMSVPHAQNHVIVLVSLAYFHSLSRFSQLLVLRGVSFISATKPTCWVHAHQSWVDVDSFPKVLGTAVNIYGPGIGG